jgi:hypothetical protein
MEAGTFTINQPGGVMSDYVVIIEGYKTFTGSPIRIEQKVVNIKAENGKSLADQISAAKMDIFVYW